MAIANPKVFQVVLTSIRNQKQIVEVAEVAPGQFRVKAALGLKDIEDYALAFETNRPKVTNLDSRSESYTCFNLSEHLKLDGPDFTFRDNTFFVTNLEQLQAGLNQLRGAFVHGHEF